MPDPIRRGFIINTFIMCRFPLPGAPRDPDNLVRSLAGVTGTGVRTGAMSNDARAITDLFATVSLGAPENAVGFVLWRVVHRYQRAMDRALAALGLTHLQFTTLTLTAWLGRAGGAVTQAELARFGDIHPMQVSLMLRALEHKALVARPRSRSDVRARNVEVTPAGLTALRRALPVAIEVQQRVFGDEGRPGGRLLAGLLGLDGKAPEATHPGAAQARAGTGPGLNAACENPGRAAAKTMSRLTADLV